MSEQDTREQIEAWAHEEIAEKWAQSDREVTMIMDDLLELLDRQEAITTSELCGDYTYMKADRDLKVREAQELQAKVDELTAERDQLSRDLTAEHALLLQFEYDNERLREAIDAMENGQFYAMYRDECAQLEALRAAQHDKPGT